MTKKEQFKRLERAYREDLKSRLEWDMVCTSEVYTKKLHHQLVDSLSLKQCFLLQDVLKELQ